MGTVASATLAAIESMQATLRVAAALLGAERRIDLTGLEVEAARLCTAIGLMPEAEARALRPALEVLVQDLDRLAVALPRPAEP